ncbi:hypothetical protein [Sandarakinorhabdus sp.]|uniref:hypothetical protein n=1 Tax=Sandarakinorhabdus sp. TaxID=1916663 RepID=UPI00286EB413|nr:hypothetical protein [Sandarakinorhabdus sp.]
MLMLSQVLALAGMKKSDFDTRRARRLLGFFPLDQIGSYVDERDPRPSARAKYTLADAFALDLFQQATVSRLPSNLIDAMIRNTAGQFDTALARVGEADLFLACALVGESRAPDDDDGRGHAMIGTARELLPWIERDRLSMGGPGNDLSQVVLLNLSASRRRVMARVNDVFNKASSQ